MPRKKKDPKTEGAKNAEVLAELLVKSSPSTHLSIKILNKLLEARSEYEFFETMFEENMSHGECPHCGHANHWLIPEDELNKMDWVTHKQDSRVPDMPNHDDCTDFAESCQKKKVLP